MLQHASVDQVQQEQNGAVGVVVEAGHERGIVAVGPLGASQQPALPQQRHVEEEEVLRQCSS